MIKTFYGLILIEEKDDDMDTIVECPICHSHTAYGNIYWRDGVQMCESCIKRVWERDKQIQKEKEEAYRQGYKDARYKYE